MDQLKILRAKLKIASEEGKFDRVKDLKAQIKRIGSDRTKNEHLYEVSQEFQDWWADHCNEPHKALMEKLMAWKAWEHVCNLWDQGAGK